MEIISLKLKEGNNYMLQEFACIVHNIIAFIISSAFQMVEHVEKFLSLI